ncbi:MAG: DJ-1/PfpI family protein [Rhodospirillaceae bacterium]
MTEPTNGMTVAILLFDGITPLDAIGPFEVLGRVPGCRIKCVGKKKGLVRTKGGTMAMNVDYTLDEVPQPEIILVPGGQGADSAAKDPKIVGWVKRAHETSKWTTSVCTGALILAAAGVLDGIEATTHWRALDMLRKFGATPVRKRMVKQGKVVTAAGVSAGIDMAFDFAADLAGEEIAKAIQLGIEYDPEPPFDGGDFDTAPPERIDMVRTALPRP